MTHADALKVIRGALTSAKNAINRAMLNEADDFCDAAITALDSLSAMQELVATVRSRHEQMCWHQGEAARLAQEMCGDLRAAVSFLSTPTEQTKEI